MPDYRNLTDDPILAAELPAPIFDFKVVHRSTVFVLEAKKQMKKRGVPSPNRADALALTFAGPVNPHTREERHKHEVLRAKTAEAPFGG